MVKAMIRALLILIFLIIACEDVKRVWDNPYDPRSDRSLWTPDSLSADSLSANKIQLNWIRKGRDFDGFIIDRKIGESEWVDSLVFLWDSIYTWTDTLDLKAFVKNPVAYTYRLYAFADSNISNSVTVNFKLEKPNKPAGSKILSIEYENKPPKIMTVEWEKSSEGDYKKYHIYHANIDDFDNRKLYKSISDVNELSLETTIFTVLKENWFWVGVEDTTGQMDEKIKESKKGIPVDLPPLPVVLDSITHEKDKFQLKWSLTSILDFSEYIIEEVSLPDSSVLSSDTISTQAVIDSLIDVIVDQENYYRIKLNDDWGNSSFSQIQGATSYQKVVKVDYIQRIGDDLTIHNLGPNLPFTIIRPGVNVQFPIWIQDGNKIFSLIADGVGRLVNEDGSGSRIILGEEPQDITFNNDNTLAVFTGKDHNIYLAYIEKDQAPIKITNQTNNEWYSDPEFIDNGNKILYAQRIHESNNNIGVQDIFTMDLDGKNISQITRAPNVDKYLMPRMSSVENKILYVNKGDGLYAINFPGDTTSKPLLTGGGDKVIPEISLYYRNIRWSPDKTKAVLWTNVNSSYFLYIYDPNASPELELLQPGGRYADWIHPDTVLFRYESSNAMFKKYIHSPAGDDPVFFYDAPWAQLQPKQ